MKKSFILFLLFIFIPVITIVTIPQKVRAANFDKKREGYYAQINGDYRIDVTYITKKHVYYTLYHKKLGGSYLYKYYPVKIKSTSKAYDKESKMTFRWNGNKTFKISCSEYSDMEGRYILVPETPEISDWKKVSNLNSEGDGVRYAITWNKVKGATGYEVKFYEKEAENGDWYIWKQTTKKCAAYVEFSSGYQFKVKVRSYKVINGKKIYGRSWSNTSKKTMYW